MANYQTKQEKPEAMDEAMSLTQLGCKLARELESNLPNLANQPNLLSISIDEILKAFTSARGKLLSPDQIQIISSFAQMLPQAETQQAEPANLLIHEWLRSGFPQPGDLIQTQQQGQAPKSTTAIGGIMEFSKQMIRSRGEGSERSRGSEGEVQPMEASPSPSRQRRRKDNDAEKETVVVAAPQYGNTEVPPEDGYTWRKYGQKEILGSKYPRSYYRCTHQKLCECPAKKQVQRLDNNPNLFHVTYRGKHTCHMSSTAPSSRPPHILVNISRDMTQSSISPQSSTSHSLSGWLSTAHLSLHGGSTMAPVAAGDAGAGPSTSSSRYGGRGDSTNDYDPAVADLADAMFNSGSSSSNSMELIFRSEDKHEPADKKS